jgi:hypothetical protein
MVYDRTRSWQLGAWGFEPLPTDNTVRQVLNDMLLGQIATHHPDLYQRVIEALERHQDDLRDQYGKAVTAPNFREKFEAWFADFAVGAPFFSCPLPPYRNHLSNPNWMGDTIAVAEGEMEESPVQPFPFDLAPRVNMLTVEQVNELVERDNAWLGMPEEQPQAESKSASSLSRPWRELAALRTEEQDEG